MFVLLFLHFTILGGFLDCTLVYISIYVHITVQKFHLKLVSFLKNMLYVFLWCVKYNIVAIQDKNKNFGLPYNVRTFWIFECNFGYNILNMRSSITEQVLYNYRKLKYRVWKNL